MNNSFWNTIEKPWRQPMDYLSLVFWFVIFVIVATALLDGLRVTAAFVEQSVKG